MYMLVLGIVMADYDIGLFAITHMFHITFGEFEKFPVVQIFTTGKVEGDVRIPFFGIMPIAKMVQYPSEKLHVSIRIGIGILKADYGALLFAQDILQHALYAFSIKHPCYHF